MKSKLTVKQEKFTLNLFAGMNQSQAYIKAGYANNTAVTVTNNASRLAKNAFVIQRLEELRSKAESAKIATVQERKEILTEILRAKLTDFMELGQDGSWVNIGPETKSGHAIQEIHSRTEYDKNGASPTIYTSVKLINPIEAIKELNKMEGIGKEDTKVNILNQTIIQNNLTSLSDEELNTLERIVEKTTVIGSNQTGESPQALN